MHASLNGSLFDHLVEMGYSGTLEDMLYQFFKDGGHAGETLRSLEQNYLLDKGAVGQSMNDLWKSYLVQKNYSGSVSDMKSASAYERTLLNSELPFIPSDLFMGNATEGAWYDPSDLATLFQDVSGIDPVTAIGQPVGLIRDKSGRGRDIIQSTATARPVLQQNANGKYYLSFDGVDDVMVTTFPETIVSGFVFAHASATSSATSSFKAAMSLAHTTGAHYADGWCTYGDRQYFTVAGVTTSNSISKIGNPDNMVPRVMMFERTDSQNLRVNTAIQATVAATAGDATLNRIVLGGTQHGTGTVGSKFAGQFYGGVILLRAPTATELSKINTYLGKKIGVVL